MEVDDPIAISMAIDEKLIVIDRSLNDNQQEPYEVKHVVREKGKEKQKNDDDRKHATEKNIEVNANEGVQAVNVNVNISIEKEGNATNEKGNLSLATSNKKEILNDDKSDVAKKNNKKEKDDEKKEYKESCATGDEKLKPNLRRKLSRRSSASPFKQLEQQEGEGQRSPESIEDNGDLKLVVEEEEEDEDSDGVTTMKRKRHNVRKSGSDEYLLGFDEQSGEAELIKMEIDGEEVNAISSGILSEDIDVSPSTFKLNKVSTGLTTPEKQSESDTEIKQGEHGNKFINSHIVGDNEDAGIINKKSFPQTRNSKIGGTVPKSSTLMSVPGTSGGQAAKRPPQSDYYKKPFKYGWKRELVWRANLETSKDKADVYFISPAGKKLRARSDIIPLLEGDLTIEHFCFAREPLGVGPDLEIVRSAKPSSRTTVTAATLAAAASPTNIGKRISKPKGPKGASPPPQGWTPSQALKVNNAALLSSTNAAHRHSSSYQYHYQHQVSSTASSAALSPSSRRGQNSEAQSHHHQQSISHTSTPMSMSSHSVSSTGSGSGSSANKSSSKLKKSITTTPTAITAATSVTAAAAVPSITRQEQQQQQQQQFEINSNIASTIPATTITTTAIPISGALTYINSGKNNTTITTATETVIATTIVTAAAVTTTTTATTSSRKDAFRREPCSVTCAKAPGLVPQLQCIKCLCHYHHQCVGLTAPNIEYRTVYNSKEKDYICENCTEKEKVSLNKKLTSPAVIRRTATENTGNKYHPQTIAVVKAKKYVMVAKSLLSTAGNQQANDIENDLKQINESIRQHRKHSFEMGKITTMPASGALSVTAAINSNSKNNNSNSINAITTSQELQHINKMFVSNFFANISYAYSSLLNILKYLKIHERSRAASVCKLWNLAAKDTSLWHTVRMKNSKVCSWSGFVAALRRGETKHLDLRKMLVSNTRNEEFWLDFSQCIGTVCSLEIIDLCRCSARVVESLFLSNSNLKILNAMAINDDTLNLDNIYNLQNLKELRLRPCELLTLAGDLMPLATLTQLTHLSLTAIRGLGGKCIEILSELSELKSLELGECGDFERQFADEVLPKLLKLQRLRLENGQQTNCCTLAILDGLAQLPQLEQLELVNFDIKTGFDEKLRLCRHLTKLMIIPTYISQSATTNRIVLSAVQQVADTLKCFTWVVTIELLRVTALYVDQCEESTKKEKHHFDECIPVLKPVPGAPVTINDDDDVDNVDEKYNGKKKTTNALISSNKDLDGSTEAKIKSRESKGDDDVDASMTDGGEVPQIEILPLDKVEMILAENLPQTKFTIVKVPYHQTSKQHLVE